LSSSESLGPFELGDNFSNVDSVVRSWIKDYSKRTKVQKNMTEIFINQNGFQTDTVYNIVVDESQIFTGLNLDS